MKKVKKQSKEQFITKSEHNRFLKFIIVALVLLIVIALCFFVCKYTGLWEKVNSIDKIQKIVKSGGVFSFLIFIILQILQTTILQIPAVVVTLAGTFIFGNWQAFILSYVAVMIGSVIMFYIGRRCGRKFLYWFCGEQCGEKWIKRMSNGKYLFFLMMLFPLFPDDILCAVVGVTNMSFKFFFLTNVFARGIGIACTVFFGSGAIIPFSGWGWIVWGIIAVFMVSLFYISIRYKDKIDEALNNCFKKRK